MVGDWQTAIALAFVAIAIVHVIWVSRRWLKGLDTAGGCTDCQSCPQARSATRAPQRISLVQLDGEDNSR
jgi:hypothetical protein